MRRIFNIMLTLAIVPALYSCKGSPDKAQTLVVSISPVKYIVEAIVGDDFEIEVLVPNGSSPETYSPTPAQIVDSERASLIFITGLIDFENELAARLAKIIPGERIIDLSAGIEILAGECSHSHAGHSHHHGVDPHIWTSPKQLKVMADNAYKSIIYVYPDSIKYTRNYDLLQARLDELSDTVRQRIDASGRKFFLIYHPALTYYARDYGIEQVALEAEGKEPSAAHMTRIIDRARTGNIKHILYQQQFSRATVETLASDIGAIPVEIDPLRENIIEEILYVTNVITE